MSSLKDKIKGEPIHRRVLDLRTFPVGDAKIIVEGSLRDERFRAIYEISGQKREKGVIHDLVIRLLAGGSPLKIEDAEAEMPHVPRELCKTTGESIRKIIGLEIRSGFGERVHKMIGGVRGCAHLTHLVVVMAQEALHGFWTHKMSKPGPPPGSLQDVEGLEYLVNSCSIWRKNGPAVEEIERLIEERKAAMKSTKRDFR
jgi:Protein of unknown function (DUF2889)